jgi:KUP system potassium uptake protein
MQPKRAKVYWFLHIEIADVPYGITYKTETILPEKAFFVKLNLGFKEPHLINHMMKKIHADLVKSGEISANNIFDSLSVGKIPVDFKYILINSRVATDNHLTLIEVFAVKVYRLLKSTGLTAMEDFGLDTSSSVEEKIPINVAKTEKLKITRLES